MPNFILEARGEWLEAHGASEVNVFADSFGEYICFDREEEDYWGNRYFAREYIPEELSRPARGHAFA